MDIGEMAEPNRRDKSWRKSALIRAALAKREPDQVSVVYCDGCGSLTYYNDGSHCSCEHCGLGLDHLLDEDSDEILTMADIFDAIDDELYPP